MPGPYLPIAPVPVDLLPTPPTTQDEINFDPRADEFVGKLPPMAVQTNAISAVTYNNALSAKESADSALADKAIVAADKAIVANYKAGAETAKNQAEILAAAAQAAAGLPATAGKDGSVLSVVAGAVAFARLRGEKQLRSKSFTAQTGKSYAITTLAGAITMTLPSTPNPFTSIEMSDYGQVAHKNKITIAQNGITQIAKTNILLQSKNLFVSPWASAPSAGFTVTQSTDIPAPDGLMGNVTKYVAASPVQQLFTRQAGLTIASASTRMVSMYVFIPSGQVTDYQVQFDYNDVDTATASSTTFDQWVRVSALITTTAARTTLNAKIKVNGGNTPAIGFVMYAGFAQDEDGNMLTGNGDTNAGWTLFPNLTRVGNVTGVDGGMTATSYTTNQTTNAYLSQFAKASGNTTCIVTLSAKLQSGSKPTLGHLLLAYAEMNGDEVQLELAGGLAFADITLDTTWREYTFTFTTKGAGNVYVNLLNNFGNGAQIAIDKVVMKFGFPTTFITTTTTAVTRSAGVFNYPIMGKNASYIFDVKGGNAIVEFVNEFMGWQITQLQKRPEANIFDNGTSGAFNYQNGQHQKWAPSGATQNITVTGWAEEGLRSDLVLEVTNLGLVTTINWGLTINWFKGDGTFVTSFPATGIVFNSAGKDFIFLYNSDGTVYGRVMR